MYFPTVTGGSILSDEVVTYSGGHASDFVLYTPPSIPAFNLQDVHHAPSSHAHVHTTIESGILCKKSSNVRRCKDKLKHAGKDSPVNVVGTCRACPINVLNISTSFDNVSVCQSSPFYNSDSTRISQESVQLQEAVKLRLDYAEQQWNTNIEKTTR